MEDAAMNDSSRMALGLIASIALMVLATALLLCACLPFWAFIVMMAVSVAIIPLSTLGTGGYWVKLKDDRISIEAPLTKLDIPFGSVTGLEIVSGFEPGIRTYGYSGLKRGAGDFTNRTLGSYTFAGTTAVDKMIVVRFTGRNGKPRIVAFNLPDLDATEKLYGDISTATSCGGIERTPEEIERATRSHRSMKRVVWGVTVASLAIVAVVIALAMTAGHVDVTLDEDSVTIDATMKHRTIRFDNVLAVELRDGMDYGVRVGGLSGSDYLCGNFRNDEFGNYDLAVHRHVGGCIVIHTEGRAMVFNLGSEEATEKFFGELQDAVSAYRSGGAATFWMPTTA